MKYYRLSTTLTIALALNACNPDLAHGELGPLGVCGESEPPAPDERESAPEPLPTPEPAETQCISMR